jgi:hypothetical protein
MERKTNKLVPSKVNSGDLMALVYFVKVQSVQERGEYLVVTDVDQDQGPINVRGKTLVENSFSADQFSETEKVTKTAAAELLVNSFNRPFKVCYTKQDGEERVLRGRLIQPEPLLGRSMVEDLDADKKNRVRQVDHRTIQWLIVEGVKYEVK